MRGPLTTHAEPSAFGGRLFVRAQSRRTAIIGLAHGSRHPGVRGVVETLMAATAESAGVPARAAFLDLTEPDLGTVASELAADGIDRAVVVPLLFTDAFHARIDVPATVGAAAENSGLDLVTAGILGTGDDVRTEIEAAISAAEILADLPVLLYAVGSSDAAANAAVDQLAARIGTSRGTRALAAFGTTDPRPDQVIAELAGDGPIGVVPLFVSPGLLLDPLMELARERGYPIMPPLGRRLAPILLTRATAALSGAEA